MGSGGGSPGVDAEPRRDPYAEPGKAAGTRADATRMSGARKREEERLRRASFITGDQSYVTSGGNIVRSARTGAGVLTRTGVQRAEASRQQELETLISLRTDGQGDPEAEKRQMAIEQLEKRKEQTLPGFLGAVSRINIERQLADLRAGGTPQFGLSPSGTFITRGVTPQGQETPSAAANIQPMFPTQQRSDTTPEVTPLVTPEIVPDDDDQARQVRGRGAAARRATRGTRVGGGGTFETGYGALLRGPRVTAPSGSGRLT